MRSFYFDQFQRPELNDSTWVFVNKTSGQSRGYFTNGTAIPTGIFSSDNYRYIVAGTLIKFVPPANQYFSATGKLVNAESSTTVKYIWTKVIQVIGTGAGILADGTGPVILSNVIPNGAIPMEIIPRYTDVLSYSFETELVNLCMSQRNFGLTINKTTRTWDIISDSNLDLINSFSLDFQGNKTNASRDASWMIVFVWTGKQYNVRYRITDYIFESNKETSFFIDPDTINYDFTNNTVIKDQVSVLSINSAVRSTTTVNTYTLGIIGKDYQWQIDSAVVEADGYVEPKKVKVSFYDYNNSGQVTDPDTFDNIVDPLTTSNETGHLDKFVYFKKLSDGLRYELVDTDVTPILAYPTEDDAPILGQRDPDYLYYFYDSSENVMKSVSTATTTLNEFVYEPDFAYSGRSDLKFHYVHNSGEDRRIDPSKSNLVDVFLLTSAYDASYRNWLTTGVGAEPLAPTSQSLESNFSSSLEMIKTISDEIIFQPVKYKVLFGSQATVNLQATFKAVKNSIRPISDNELKTRILSAINDFFNLSNWDFGQTFYFSELSTYVMNLLTPDITNFVIVPKSSNNFGSLYEVACLSNEIFISGATIFDIEIIDAITSSQLKTTSIVTSSGS